jgi:hypothetical protein
VALPSDARLDRLVLPPLAVGDAATDAEVASAVGRAVADHLHRRLGGEP